jgi:hypothetical protein
MDKNEIKEMLNSLEFSLKLVQEEFDKTGGVHDNIDEKVRLLRKGTNNALCAITQHLEELYKEGNGKKHEYGMSINRCHWCGKVIVKEQINGHFIHDVTILCSDCFDWDKNGMIKMNHNFK